jgi:ribosomal-protein-alanine N-acetyltransferase
MVARQFNLWDADDFFRHNGDAELMRYIRTPKTRAESDAFLLENVALYTKQVGLGRFAVIDKETADFVGTFSLLSFGNTGDVHLGYVVMKLHWGRGLATEIAREGLKYARKLGYNQVYAFTDQANIASQKVLQKANFISNGFFDYQGDLCCSFIYYMV